MAETRTIELNIVDNANQTQQQFENLRQQIAKTTQEVDELTQAYGENSQEVTEAKGRLNELNTSYKELNKSATDTGATFANVYGEMQPLTTRMGEAEDRLYELALAGKTATKEYQDLLQTTQNYLRVQQSVDLQVEAGAVPAAQKMTMAVGGVSGAFGVAEGAAALFGVESQKLQETMVRLQAAMTITQGLTTIREAIPTFQAMGQAAKTALSGIRTGIAATGIGALVIAAGLLVAYWSDIKQAVSGVSSEQAKLNKKTKENLEIEQSKYGLLGKQDNILKLQGKTEKQILQLKIKGLDVTIKAAETNLANQEATAKAQYEAEKRNYLILRGILEFTTAPLALLLRTIDEVGKALGKNFGLSDFVYKNLTNIIFDPDQVKKEGDAAIIEAKGVLYDLKNEQAGYRLAIQQIDQEAANERNKINTDFNQGISDSNNKAANEQIDITRRVEDEKLRIQKESRKKELDQLELDYKRKLEDAEKELANDKDKKTKLATLEKQYEESKKADIQAINDKWNKIEYDNFVKAEEERIKAEDAAWLELQKARNSQQEQELFDLQLAYDAKIAAANGNAEAEKAITEKFNKEYAAINKKYADAEAEEKKKKDEEELARIQELNKAKFQLAYDGLQLVSDLSSLFGAQDEKKARLAFQVDKAAKISSATIAGYEAVLEAYKTGQKSPLTVAFPAYPYVQAGLAGAFAAVNIAKIAKAKFQASGGGGSMSPSGGGGAGGGAMTANFNTIGSSGINQLAQLQQTPTQAYVVSGEVTSAQALDRNRVQNATL